jgi:transcription factor WhiB
VIQDHPAMAPGLTTRERLDRLSEHELKMYNDRKARMYNDRAWMVDALCRTKAQRMDYPSIDAQFFPDRNSANRSISLLHPEKVAKALCVRCPVRKRCLEYGRDENYGIWGGTLPRERGRYRYRANGKGELSADDLLDEMDEQAFRLGLVSREEKAG